MSLLEQLRNFWADRQSSLSIEFNRTLPLGDYIVDRWEKAKKLGFGEGTSIYDTSHVFGDVIVGKNSWIGPFTILDGSGKLSIGDNCSISAGVQIYSHDTVAWARSGGQEPYDYAATCIEDNCYIGPNTVVAKGVTIGRGAVIGANSLVLKDIPAAATAYGTPAQITTSS